jgi:hypothetical protein
MNNQDEMKLLTVTREQFRQQKEALVISLKERDAEVERLNKKLKEMTKLVDSMCVAQKSLNHNEVAPGDQAAALDKARDDIERSERIAKSTNKSSFMALGEKQPKLLSEDVQAKKYGTTPGNNAVKTEVNERQAGLDDAYLRDDSLPTEVFSVIQSYRDRIIKQTKGSQSAALLFDDFFGEIHALLKDQHMREIARIRNEHSVEVIKLRKTLESRLKSASATSVGPVSKT